MQSQAMFGKDKARLLWGVVWGGVATLLIAATVYPEPSEISRVRRPTRRLTPAVFPHSTPEAQGMDSSLLAQAIDFLLEQRELYNIHSLSLVRRGRLVTDVDFYPAQPSQLHNIASISKVFTSTLVGIAIDRGHIASVDTKMVDFFPDRTIANLDDDKRSITVEHLLTMTSGLGGVLPYEEESESMEASADWLQFALDLPMTSAPGSTFRYSNLNIFLLSAIITETTGMSAHEFAKRHLLRPLGIVESEWWPVSPQGFSKGSGGLMLSPHDLAVFGQLFLQRGRWRGRQPISQSWVSSSTTAHVDGHYGYCWARYPGRDSFFYAAGAKGQRLVVSPDHDLVAVFSGGGYSHSDIELVYLEALESFILPAVQSDVSLPPNPVGTMQLNTAIEGAESPGREPHEVPPLPDIAGLVSGTTYVMEDNPYGILTLTVNFPADDEAQLHFTSTGQRTYDPDFDWAAGFDGIERFARGRLGILAAGTAEWNDDRSFVMTVDELGNLELFRLTVVFEDEGDGISVTVEDMDWWRPQPTFVMTGST